MHLFLGALRVNSVYTDENIGRYGIFVCWNHLRRFYTILWTYFKEICIGDYALHFELSQRTRKLFMHKIVIIFLFTHLNISLGCQRGGSFEYWQHDFGKN